MDLFTSVLQGGYLYLVIGQILVVTLLFLSLLWLVVKRAREGATWGETLSMPAQPAVEIPAATPSAPAPQPAKSTSEPTPPPKYAEPEPMAQPEPAATTSPSAPTANATPAPAPASSPTGLGDDNHALIEKVKYLESKLLEYEILQEEIGALSALKMENEQLKQKLVYLNAPPKPIEPSSETPAISSLPAQQKDPSQAALLSDALDKALIFDAPKQTEPQQLHGLASPVVESELPKEPKASELKEEGGATVGLDQLLKQIDDLTKSGPDQP